MALKQTPVLWEDRENRATATTETFDRFNLLGMQGVEKSNPIGQTADLNQVVAGQTQDVGPREIAEGGHVIPKAVFPQPLRRLLTVELWRQFLTDNRKPNVNLLDLIRRSEIGLNGKETSPQPER